MVRAVLIGLFLLGTGSLAGVLLAVEMAMVPMLCALRGDRWVEVHRLLDPGFDPLMPRVNRVVLALGIVLIVVAGPAPARVAFGLAVAGIVGVALVSELRNVPMNRRIDAWAADGLPDDWPRLRERWARANRLRTLFAAAGFAAAVCGAAFART
ncbi:anthrone oxygenase family protein [Actinoallomurus sp. CA-150999]|uniref:anthrone oxygenase family protein n=1 Tax=Actinoallomurus sp. CA-150999 TaxID=3239887 RepID=UPI003D945266